MFWFQAIWYDWLEAGVVKGGQGGPSPPHFQNNKNKCIFNAHTINVCLNCSWQCPGTYSRIVTHLSSFYLSSRGRGSRVLVPEATHARLRALEERHVSSKKIFKGSRQKRKSCWEERKEKVFRNDGSLIYLTGGRIWLFTYLACEILHSLHP